MMNPSDQPLYIRENYFFMLEKLGPSARQELIDSCAISAATENRIRHSEKTISDRTINELVHHYNQYGDQLSPPYITLEDFKYKQLSTCSLPIWHRKQVIGNYICLYLSRKGIGKAKAMILTIQENEHHELEARLIDAVHQLDKASTFIEEILSIRNLAEARAMHKQLLKSQYSFLRGSHFLHGKVSGRLELLTIHLKDEKDNYEMTLAASLSTYLKNLNKIPAGTMYPWRGGSILATIYDRDSWPYSIVMGITRDDYWHPDLMTMHDITDALQRMDSYQKKANMLCLQNDIDALFYESIMDVHRQSETDGET